MSSDETEFKVGDKVRLTGEEWAYSDRDGYGMGTIHTVTGFGEDGNPRLNNGDWFIFQGEGYDAEVLASGGEALLDLAKTSTKERAILEETATRVFGEPQTVHDISSFEQSVRRITDQIADLLIAKNKAYGDSALNPIRVFSKSDRIEQLNVRIDDKISRIQRGTDFEDEDTERDLIGYLILKLIAKESE